MKTNQKKFLTNSIAVCATVFALLSGFEGFSLGPKEFAREFVAAVGASAGVLPNEYNTLAQSLFQKETEVNQRERALAEREAEVMREGSRKDTLLISLALSVGFLLMVLILLNFYLDWKRRK